MARLTQLAALAFLLFASTTIASPLPPPNAEIVAKRDWNWCYRCWYHIAGEAPADE
ncbi:hypothetical protein GYMLUDRAFT_238913 [Collybiopsis luxurians FD-317 M1]|nr:hypothetical protein GYMLUDRAFT_238913 [Collybiopsis luxurians FD-317 M1]